MKSDFFALYDTLIGSLPACGGIDKVCSGERWAMVESVGGAGIAMATVGDSIPPMFPHGLEGLTVSEAATAVKSWNMAEAGLGMAAVNAAFNTPQRLESLACYEPFEKYPTDGIDFTGKTVGLVGHMHGPDGMREKAKAVYTLEREPRTGDYPDSACDYILPMCDIVLITGSALVNKTLPHLLKLCRDAYTILTGPTVPMCPALLELGIDRLAGLVLFNRDGIRAHVSEGRRGSPYGYGKPFLLKK